MLSLEPSGGWLPAFGASYLMIALAEIGDKSQLVIMTLAARHRALPVVIGAIAAFCLLNLLAVLFGAALAAWLPEWLVASVVAILFAIFGIQSLRQSTIPDNTEIEEKSDRSVLLSSFMLIFLAEFGDKTQIAVAGLASTASGTAIWVGATLALATTSLLGAFAGARWLKRLPVNALHRASGIFFLILAALAAAKAFSG